MTPVVVCVKTGRLYGPEYVNRLHRAFLAAASLPFDFLCLTDNPIGLECPHAPTGTTLTGWWTRLVLFAPHPRLAGRRVISVDLDVVVTGGVDWLLAHNHAFSTLRDFYVPNKYNGSVYVISPDLNRPDVYSDFGPRIGGYYSDQEWITNKIPGACILQDEYPGRVVSYKTHTPDWTRPDLVVFHGEPKPHQLPEFHPLAKTWRKYDDLVFTP